MIREAFYDEAMSEPCIFLWHKAFKAGRQNVDDIEGDRRPSTPVTETMLNTAAVL